MFHTENQIKMIQAAERPTRVIENCFAPEDLEFLKKQILSLSGEPAMGSLLVEKFWQGEVKELVWGKVKEFCPNSFVGFSRLRYRLRPTGLHADNSYDPSKVVSQAVIVPIEITPKENPHRFVVFKDRWYGPHAFVNAAGDWVHMQDSTVFSKKLVEQYFHPHSVPRQASSLDFIPHINQEFAARLTIDTIAEWKPGNVIIFNRSQLHCSEHFQSSKTFLKVGIMLFLEVDEEVGSPPGSY